MIDVFTPQEFGKVNVTNPVKIQQVNPVNIEVHGFQDFFEE